MILETHGDTCRLGYLRLIPCILSDEEPRSFDYISSILFEVVRNVGLPDLSLKNTIGLITRPVNARNYVTLAVEMGIIDRRSQKLGLFGRIYLALRSSEAVRDLVEGRSSAAPRDLIELSEAERVYFLWLVSISDYPFIQQIISWAAEKEKFTRQEAMNYIMEEAYPASLKKILSTLSDSRRKRSVEQEIAEAEQFREKRTSISDKTEWIRTSQYSKYRHVAPPRLEWLVDIGILRRDGRGKYSVDEQVSRHLDRFLKVSRMSVGKLEEFIFEEAAKIMFSSLRSANRYDISRAIVDAYSRLEKNGLSQIRLDYLEKVASLMLIERRLQAPLSTIHDVFNSLAIRFPDKIYIAPSSGGVLNVARIDLTESEI